MKKKIVILWLSFLLVAVISIFWYNAWIYALPTPVPSNYITIRNGTKIYLPEALKADDTKPVFSSFF